MWADEISGQRRRLRADRDRSAAADGRLLRGGAARSRICWSCRSRFRKSICTRPRRRSRCCTACAAVRGGRPACLLVPSKVDRRTSLGRQARALPGGPGLAGRAGPGPAGGARRGLQGGDVDRRACSRHRRAPGGVRAGRRGRTVARALQGRRGAGARTDPCRSSPADRACAGAAWHSIADRRPGAGRRRVRRPDGGGAGQAEAGGAAGLLLRIGAEREAWLHPRPGLHQTALAMAGLAHRGVDLRRRRAGFLGRPRPMLRASSRRCCA